MSKLVSSCKSGLVNWNLSYEAFTLKITIDGQGIKDMIFEQLYSFNY